LCLVSLCIFCMERNHVRPSGENMHVQSRCLPNVERNGCCLERLSVLSPFDKKIVFVLARMKKKSVCCAPSMERKTCDLGGRLQLSCYGSMSMFHTIWSLLLVHVEPLIYTSLFQFSSLIWCCLLWKIT
jgi:hypothetical protein